ncbi:MAG: ATP-binding cassette domain-containing protein [Rhodospirillaceae bacterium]
MGGEPFVRLSGATIKVPDVRRAHTIKHYLLSATARVPQSGTSILSDVTLEARPGDRIGVIGRNGAGKSTLIKMVAGIYPLTSGLREVNGHITTMLDRGIGLESEASLRRNVKIGLAYQNMLHAYSVELEKEILEFAELTDRANDPFKVLSSGMKARFAFAISLFQAPQILLLDEAFATGDAAFIHKAVTAMRRQVSEAPISFLISHDNNLILDICNRALLLQDGHLIADGTPDAIIDRYNHSCRG